MLQFKISDDTINYTDALKNFINGVKVTSKIYNSDLKEQLFNALSYIIYNQRYDCITTRGGLRDSVRKYSPDVYFNIIYTLLKRNNEDLVNSLVIKSNGIFFVDEKNLQSMLNKVCNDYLFKLAEGTEIDNVIDEFFTIPEEVVYYVPSPKCRSAVLSGVQNSLKKSSAVCNGMFAYSDVGKIRNNQEDSYYIGVHPCNSNFKIMIVADGVGGSMNGEIASNIAVKEMLLWFENLPQEEFYSKDNKRLYYEIQRKVQNIHRTIRSSVRTGATTLCFSIIKNNSIIMGNIGDSQGYVIENNKLIYETTPDSASFESGIPKEIVRYHKISNVITKCLGYGSDPIVTAKLEEIKLKNRKTYNIILCSDGVSDCISEREIVNIANNYDNSAHALVEYAIENSSQFIDDYELLSKKDQKKIESNILSGQFNSSIQGGKDNTTAVSAVIRR